MTVNTVLSSEKGGGIQHARRTPSLVRGALSDEATALSHRTSS
jgi:hypothetical protein